MASVGLQMLMSMGGAAAYNPAAYVFNGTDEVLTRVLSTSGASTTIFTASFWIKVTAYGDPSTTNNQIFNTYNAGSTNVLYCGLELTGDRFICAQFGTAAWDERCNALTPDIPTATWEHWVVQYDSTQGTADNRLRFYRGGSIQTDTDGTDAAPGASEAHFMFTNGHTVNWGGFDDADFFGNQKLAFIDVLDGVTQDASAFAFNNGGTWTRKRYTGSYGTYGYKLDGSNGFSDVSGNNQHFTGTNMDVSNIQTGDLPPYINT